MKTCPSCHKTYADDSMIFCVDDGTALPAVTAVSDPNATLLLPDPRVTAEPGPTTAGNLPPTVMAQPLISPFAAPVGSVAAKPPSKSVLPWLLGIAVVLGISGIVIAVIVARAFQLESRAVAPLAVASPTPSGSDQSAPAPTPTSELQVKPSPADQAVDTRTTVIPPGGATGSPPPVRRGIGTEAPSAAPPRVVTRDEPAPPPAKATPHAPISGGVLNAKALHLAQPTYPAIAKAAHASGTVIVQVLIDETGNVISAQAVSGHPLLKPSAVSAARASKFSPTKLSGQPVKVSGIIQYNFAAQ